MRWMVALVLMLVGGGVIVTGGAMALMPLVGLYRANLEDPMGQAEGAEKDVQGRMYRGVIVGAFGVPPLVVGSMMMKAAAVRRLRRELGK